MNHTALATLLLLASAGFAEEPTDSDEEPVESDLHEAEERRIIQKWNEYDFKALTLRWGAYSIIDYGNGYQNAAGRSQFEVTEQLKIRDLRFSISGKFNFKRSVTYTTGLMYDGPTGQWFPRETGIQLGIPELWGNVFIGRQKEGFSLSKISVGYSLWTMERMPMNDASLPILADGIKWLGVAPNKRANWNVAYFHNLLPKSPATDWYEQTVVARFAALPIRKGDEKQGDLLHLGVGYHYGIYSNGEAQLRSRPESFTAPYFLDTGVFPAKENHLVGFEAYYRRGSWLYGSEYFFNQLKAPTVGNPLFHGGEASVVWIVTGETRPYHDVGGKLGFVTPNHSAFDGGPGAFELVLHGSYSDFRDGAVDGGTFWRLTPHINWYLDDLVRLEVAYGFGLLERFGVLGATHFVQSRIQFQIQ